MAEFAEIVTRTVNCPYCHDSTVVKNGKGDGGKQRYKCKPCGKRFLDTGAVHGRKNPSNHVGSGQHHDAGPAGHGCGRPTGFGRGRAGRPAAASLPGPTGLSLSAASDRVTLDWTAPAGAVSGTGSGAATMPASWTCWSPTTRRPRPATWTTPSIRRRVTTTPWPR